MLFLSIMAKLLDALKAEVRGQWEEASAGYSSLAKHASPLDRIGLHQMSARCFERQESRRQAARQHQSAGQAYMFLSDKDMPKDERNYLALVEFRSAIWDLISFADISKSLDLVDDFTIALETCWAAFPDGITHEALFGACLLESIGDHAEAGKYFKGVAELMAQASGEKGSGGGDLPEAARDSYEAALECYRHDGDSTSAEAIQKLLGSIES